MDPVRSNQREQVVEIVPAPGVRPEQRGSVTAEAAIVLPIVAAFALTLVWMLSVGIAKVQVVDAARDGARAIARGEDDEQAIAQARETAGEGSQISVDRGNGSVTVTVSFVAGAPGWLLVPLPEMTVGSRSTVDVEGNDAAVP
ncbi:MAG: TadE family protein [Nocardioidaceae bacterium]